MCPEHETPQQLKDGVTAESLWPLGDSEVAAPKFRETRVVDDDADAPPCSPTASGEGPGSKSALGGCREGELRNAPAGHFGP